MISRCSQSVGRFSPLKFSYIPVLRKEFLLLRPENAATTFSSLPIPIGFASRTYNGCISSVRYRTYVTRPVSRPKAHTGRTTKTSKRKTTTTTNAAEPSSAETSEEEVVKNAKPKRKYKIRRAKRKKAKSKSRSKPRPKRELTEEEKASLSKQKEKEKIKALKAAALKPPTRARTSAWQCFAGEKLKGLSRPLFPEALRSAAQDFRDLTPDRLEHYNHLANQNKTSKHTEYQQWVQSHTPQQIRTANLARLSLRRKGVRGYFQIQDDRQVRGCLTAYTYFSKERHASGDFKGIAVKESSKLIGKEWKALSSSEQKPYVDLAAQDRQRYNRDFKSTFNIDRSQKKTVSKPDSTASAPATTAAAAAA